PMLGHDVEEARKHLRFYDPAASQPILIFGLDAPLSRTIGYAIHFQPSLQAGQSDCGGGMNARGWSRRCAPRGRRKSGVAGVVLGRHLGEELSRLEARAMLLFQPLAEIDEALGAHHVDVGESAARKRREAEAEARADTS